MHIETQTQRKSANAPLVWVSLSSVCAYLGYFVGSLLAKRISPLQISAPFGGGKRIGKRH
jgi:hypothetical protein